MPVLSVRVAALGLLAIAALSRPALAEPDAGEVARGLTDAIAAVGEGVSASYDDASGDAGAVTVSGLRVTLSESVVLSIPTVVLVNVAPRETGGFVAARIDFDNGTLSSAEYELTWAAATVEDVVIPAAAEVRTHPKIRPFATMSLTTVSLGGPALSVPIESAGINVDVEDITDDAPTNVRVNAAALRLPAALLANSIAGVIVGMLNYSEFLAEVSLHGVYDTAADTASLQTLAVDIATVGKLDLRANASDFSIRAITDPDEEVAKQARADARLDSLTLRIDNAGFVERVLDMQAAMLGGTRDDVRTQIVDGALPFALSFVKNEDFRAEFRAAIADFLADPRSLTIVVEPPEPLPLGQVARTVVRSPMALPDLLDPSVEVNTEPDQIDVEGKPSP
ncbi:MAG: hypothetical protein WD099_05030 [Dongiaceae bacterium]